MVTFGAFVEILDGVEGLVHISELAQHHVENPREIIQPGDPVRVKILEIDSERRRLSLSIKRVEGQVLPVRPIVPPSGADAGDLDDVPELGLSEDVFAASDERFRYRPNPAPRPRRAEAVGRGPRPEVVAAPEVVAEPAPEVEAEPAPEAAVEPAPEAVVEPAPEAVAEPAPAAEARGSSSQTLRPPEPSPRPDRSPSTEASTGQPDAGRPRDPLHRADGRHRRRQIHALDALEPLGPR